MKKAFSIALALMFALTLLAGCGSAPASSAVPDEPASSAPAEVSSVPEESSEPQPDPVTILVAAAASLENTYVEELIPLFQQQYPWVTVEGSYDSSGKLQTQIEEGLEADVFMSAATKQMTALSDAGLVDVGTVVDLLENEIVLIAPTDSDLDITSFEDIINADTIALGDPESVPAGQYAQEALTSLGLWDAVQAKTVSYGTNVTEVLNWVAEGSADVGIVYATDAASKAEEVKILATAPEGSLESKVIYPVGIVAASANREAAELFVEFLQTPEAMDIFIAYGFRSNL